MSFFNKTAPPKNLLCAMLVMVMFFGVYADTNLVNGQALSEESVSLRDVLEQLETAHQVSFFYLTDDINPELTVANEISNMSLNDALASLNEHYAIAHSKKGSQIVLSLRKVQNSADSPNQTIQNTQVESKEGEKRFLYVKQDQVNLSGRVISSEDNEGLPGVNIIVKETGLGTVTDLDGNFSLDVKPGQTLLFSYIGFLSQTIVLPEGQTNIEVVLRLDTQELAEVVVLGYGTVNRRDLTGAVSSVKSQEITRIPTHNAMEAIQGRVAGVDIVRSSGAAGAGVNVRIRGNRSIAGEEDRNRLNSPLYIIDGFQGGSINDLNPNDIESIEVLKDASSTAIYGYQGANGVVIITTKKGSKKDTKVSYSGYYGVNGFTEYPSVRTGDAYIDMRRAAMINSAPTPALRAQWISRPDQDLFSAAEWEAISQDKWVDWVDLIMQNGKQQSHTVSLSGGGKRTQAYVSLGYFNEESMYRQNDFSRYNVRANIDHELNDMIKTGLLSQITYYERNGRKDPLSGAISSRPYGDPYDEDGNINARPISGVAVLSPLADEIPNYADQNDINTSVNLNAYLSIAPVEWLTYRLNVGSRLYNERSGEYFDKNSYTRRNELTSYSGISNSQSRYYHIDNILTYTKDLGKHSLTATAVTNYVFSESDYSTASGVGQALASQSFYRLDAATTEREIASGYSRSNTISFAGRVNYSFDSKYLVTVSNRYDRASMLSKGYRGAFFPSAAVAWRVSDEAFLKQSSVVDDLKLRVSYGLVGNSNISPYATQSGVRPLSNMGFGDVPVSQYQFTGRVANRQVGWEKTTSLDIGVDFGFIDSRITGSLDVYKSNTSDILLLRKLPQSTGVTEVQQNVGETMTKGLELAITSVNVDNGSFNWKSTFTFTRAKEKITGLVDNTDIIVNETDSWLIGYPAQSFYTFEKLGIWQTDEADEAALLTFGGQPFQPGDIKLRDIDGDSAITTDDRTYIGSPVPKIILGLQNTFTYKSFDLTVYVVGRLGQVIEADHLSRYDPSGKGGNLELYNYWTETNPSNDYPKPENTTLSTIPGYQTLPFVDGSYVKLKTTTLGFSMPRSWSAKTPFDNFRMYVTGSNLWVKSKHHLLNDYDPEGGGSSSYPLNKQVVFGLNFDF